jgi:hypothetical protein
MGNSPRNPVSLPAIRAIEDNQASVLSLSFGACEAVLGNAGNRFWSGLWEQAAAKLRQDSRSLSNPRDGGTLEKSQFLRSLNIVVFPPWQVSCHRRPQYC